MVVCSKRFWSRLHDRSLDSSGRRHRIRLPRWFPCRQLDGRRPRDDHGHRVADRTRRCPRFKRWDQRDARNDPVDGRFKARVIQRYDDIGIVSLLAWGLGYFGQPHIIVRFMAIRNLHEMKSARRVGMIWMTFSIVGAMVTGLIGYAYFTQQNSPLGKPENVFIQLSRDLFPGFITGLLLAALLAAIMSTISTQLLVSSSAATNDFYQRFFKRDASDRELMSWGA